MRHGKITFQKVPWDGLRNVSGGAPNARRGVLFAGDGALPVRSQRALPPARRLRRASGAHSRGKRRMVSLQRLAARERQPQRELLVPVPAIQQLREREHTSGPPHALRRHARLHGLGPRAPQRRAGVPLDSRHGAARANPLHPHLPPQTVLRRACEAHRHGVGRP